MKNNRKKTTPKDTNPFTQPANNTIKQTTKNRQPLAKDPKDA